MTKKFQDIVLHYFKRYSNFSVSIDDSIPKGIKTIIVIPCFKEPDILKTLASLCACQKPTNKTLVLILVNAGEQSSEEVKQMNQNTFAEINAFIQKTNSPNLYFKAFLNNEIMAKHAGVGYARKILMDTALKIFYHQDYNGVIVNTDADCLFTKNYFISIEKAFQDLKLKLALLHYEHRLDLKNEQNTNKAIIEYELHLRYYKQALQWTNYPNVLETIGSCMACRADTYALEGGMNKRKAAEDFYFINKLAKSHKSITITEAAVLPSSRCSDRVPFGTGKAVNDYLLLESTCFKSYNFLCFVQLKKFIDQIDFLYDPSLGSFQLDSHSAAFFEKISLDQNIKNIKAQSKNLVGFKKRFFYWFDHLKALQFIHYLTEYQFPKVDIRQASLAFLKHKGQNIDFESYLEILLLFRKNEREQ